MGALVVIVLIVILVFIIKGAASKGAEKKKEKSTEYRHSAWEHAKNGNYDQAISDYTNAIQLDPEPYYTIFGERGDLYRKTGNFDRAIDDYSQVISLNRKGAEIVINAAKAAASLGRAGYSGNTNSEWKVIAETLSLRGEMHDAKGDKQQALADYDEAIRYYTLLIDNTQGKYAEPYIIAKADVYVKKGDMEKAKPTYDRYIWEYNKAIEKNPNDFEKLHVLAKMRVKVGDHDQAIANFEALINMSPDNVKNYDDIASLKSTQEKARVELDAVKKMISS